MGSSEELLPEDKLSWAREIWSDRGNVALLTAGHWMLREAAKALDLPEEVVDELLVGLRVDAGRED